MIRVIKCVYDSETSFILNILSEYSSEYIIEYYSMNNRKEAKKGRVLLTAMGTKNLPIVVFQDQNLEDVAAIWSENDPDWKQSVENILND